MATRPTPELVVGIIGALGAPLPEVAVALRRVLDAFAYQTVPIRLSDLIQRVFGSEQAQSRTADMLEAAMQRGTELRQGTKLGWAAAGLGIREIQLIRGPLPPSPNLARCFVLHSLKHPDEIDKLRAVYGANFLAIGVYSPRDERSNRLAEQFARAAGGRAADFRARAEGLIAIDDRERGTELGQYVRDAFPRADVFVDTFHDFEDQLRRIMEILFERPVVSPSRDEVGMFHAFSAAARSAALGRQVGAAICSPDGEIRATGCNEVPKAGGGQYWDGDTHDGRDFRRGYDQSDASKRQTILEVVKAFRNSGWLSDALAARTEHQLVEDIVRGEDGAPSLKDAAVWNLTEFTRDVHAEGAALLSAARQGIATEGCTLFATTFPCHNCTKHILVAGIRRVVYIEPYAKSYASEFYRDTISLDGETRQDAVRFDPFAGVAPRRYLDWFQMVRPRKDKLGQLRAWTPSEASPNFIRAGLNIDYPHREDDTLDVLRAALKSWRGTDSVFPRSPTT